MQPLLDDILSTAPTAHYPLHIFRVKLYHFDVIWYIKRAIMEGTNNYLAIFVNS